MTGAADANQGVGPISVFRTGCCHGRRAFLQLFHRDVLNVGCNMPDMSKGILQGAAAVTVELLRHRSQQFRAGRYCLFRNLVHVLHVQMDRHRSAANRAGAAKVHFRKFVGQHDPGIADLDLGMANGPLRPRHAHDLLRSEGLLVKCDRFRRSLHAEVRRDCVVPFRNRLGFPSQDRAPFLPSKFRVLTELVMNNESPQCVTLIIQPTPKRSVTMPKHGDQKVLPSGICTCPPSASAANFRPASASLAAVTDNENPLKSAPSPQPSEAIRFASPMRKDLCMILLSHPGGTWPGGGGSGLSL